LPLNTIIEVLPSTIILFSIKALPRIF
jgi:hypothetical protein